jgi:hypothetical protein
MRVHLGAVPASRAFTPDAPWHGLQEPSPWLVQLWAMPVAVGAVLAVSVVWAWLVPLHTLDFRFLFSSVDVLLSCLGIVVSHEVLHVVVHPRSGRSPQSVLGLWPSRVTLYVHYDGELSRRRFLAALLIPFIILTLGPLLVAAVTEVAAARGCFVSILNAALASVDLLGAGIIVRQVPTDAIVRNHGWRTYWRNPAQAGRSSSGRTTATRSPNTPRP